MKVEQRENGITLIYESEFEREVLKKLRNWGKALKELHFEDDWDGKGRFFIDFDTDWGN